jgi:hypothetical protein
MSEIRSHCGDVSVTQSEMSVSMNKRKNVPESVRVGLMGCRKFSPTVNPTSILNSACHVSGFGLS